MIQPIKKKCVYVYWKNELKLTLHEIFLHLFRDAVRAEKRVQDYKMTRNYKGIKIKIDILFYRLIVLEIKYSVEMGVVAD